MYSGQTGPQQVKTSSKNMSNLKVAVTANLTASALYWNHAPGNDEELHDKNI